MTETPDEHLHAESPQELARRTLEELTALGREIDAEVHHAVSVLAAYKALMQFLLDILRREVDRLERALQKREQKPPPSTGGPS